MLRLRSLFFVFLAVGSFPLLAQQPAIPQQPQAKLPTTELTISGKKLVSEVADTEPERETGMMFRKTMADGTGMLFVMDAPQQTSFWMKNTLIPLSVAYLNPSGLILEIYDMKAQDETPIPSKFDTIEYAIEVPVGWFLKNGILPGAQVQGLPPLHKP